MKHKAAGVRSWLDKLAFDTFNVCTAAVNGVNDTGHIKNPAETLCCKVF